MLKMYNICQNLTILADAQQYLALCEDIGQYLNVPYNITMQTRGI